MSSIPGVYLRQGFLSQDLLVSLAAHVGATAGELAEVQPTPGAALQVAEEVRRAWEVELPDDLHDRIIERIGSVHDDLEAFFRVPLDPCEAVAALRYPPGSFYRTHRDRAGHPDGHGLERRSISIVVFVNTGSPDPAAVFGGGSLRLHEVVSEPSGVCDITPVAGMLVAFRASQLHEVMPVEWGTRVSLVTWLLAPGAA